MRPEVWVYLSMTGPKRRQHFRILGQQQGELEKLLGGSLECDAAEHTATSHVRIRRPDTDIRDRNNWPEQHTWLAHMLRGFTELIPPRIEPPAAALELGGETLRQATERAGGAVTLSLLLPSTLKRRLEQEAARQGQATADYARAVLEEKLGAS